MCDSEKREENLEPYTGKIVSAFTAWLVLCGGTLAVCGLAVLGTHYLGATPWSEEHLNVHSMKAFGGLFALYGLVCFGLEKMHKSLGYNGIPLNP